MVVSEVVATCKVLGKTADIVDEVVAEVVSACLSVLEQVLMSCVFFGAALASPGRPHPFAI